jgi:uncharacterized protein involved in exopolysaccharide biosynthesis
MQPDGNSPPQEIAGISEKENSMDLLELYSILAPRKRWIGGAFLVGAAVAATIAFLLPDMYTASAVILPPQQQTQPVLAAIAGQLGGGGVSLKDLGLKNPADLYVGILGGRTIADEVIARFHLREQYRKDTLEETRKKLTRRTTLEAGKDTLITIEVEDPSPEQAAAMANAYVEALQEQNSRLAISEASQRRLFFERQLEAERKALAGAEAQLKSAQERTGMLHLSGQVEAAIRSVAQVRAEISAREVALERLRAGATDENPEVVRQQAELRELRQQLASLQSAGAAAPGSPLIPTGRVPATSLEYLRALRELQYHQALFELLARQYEAAKIDEAKQAPLIQVVDRAVPPDKRSGPPRTLIILLGALFSPAMAAACILAHYGVRRMKQDPRWNRIGHTA